MRRFLSKVLELLLGLGIIFVLMILIVGGASLISSRGIPIRWVMASVFAGAGAVLWIGSEINPVAFWVGPFRPRAEEITPPMLIWTRWILSTLGGGFIVTGVAYGITGHLWLVQSVLWVFFCLYLVLRSRIWMAVRGVRGGGNGT